MHPRRMLEGSAEFPCLDSEAFTREVHQLLAELIRLSPLPARASRAAVLSRADRMSGDCSDCCAHQTLQNPPVKLIGENCE